jgi:DUF4097 and DUF4098 domain-containing protein YvlB
MRSFRAVWFPILALLLAGCDDWNFGDSDRYKEDFHYTYPLTAGGRLSLDNFNGSVEISSWEKAEVEINGTKYANTQSRLNEIKIDITPSPSSISIRTTPPGDRRGNAGARYVIRVPRKVLLDPITSSNGGIRVDGIDGNVRLRTSNGTVRAMRVNGSLEANTSNGGVEASDVTGNTTIHTSNGTVRAEVKKGRFEATTSNGGINARVFEPDASNPVRLESSNGHIELSLDAPREVRARTSNSSITLRVPSSLNARLRAHTSNSSITTDFDVNVRGGNLSKHHLEGDIGSGGSLLDLETSNGGIRVLRN